MKIQKLTTEFEGALLQTYMWDDRPCWIASEVGEALGYGRGGRHLVGLVAKEWAEEFIDGTDSVKLSGESLRLFKMLAGVGGYYPFASHMTILFESGMNVVCLKTDKPLGKRLRRYLATEVIPQLVRGGEYRQGQGDRDGLLRLYAECLAPEFLPWEGRFPVEFFRQIFRLRNWAWPSDMDGRGSPRGPRYIGQLITEVIYNRLPGGHHLVAELRRRNPANENGQRRHRHHTGLARPLADGAFAELVRSATGMMRACKPGGWAQFIELWDTAYPIEGRTVWLPISLAPQLPAPKTPARSRRRKQKPRDARAD